LFAFSIRCQFGCGGPFFKISGFGRKFRLSLIRIEVTEKFFDINQITQKFNIDINNIKSGDFRIISREVARTLENGSIFLAPA